jgi:hypothetical protein
MTNQNFTELKERAIPQLARELDIYVNQTIMKSVALQRLQPQNKNYSFHRGLG